MEPSFKVWLAWSISAGDAGEFIGPLSILGFVEIFAFLIVGLGDSKGSLSTGAGLFIVIWLDGFSKYFVDNLAWVFIHLNVVGPLSFVAFFFLVLCDDGVVLITSNLGWINLYGLTFCFGVENMLYGTIFESIFNQGVVFNYFQSPVFYIGIMRDWSV